jgi:LTXXQ motif family protein
MRKISAVVAIAALAAIGAAPPPAAAFGLRIGPFYFGIPYGHRHHRPAAHSSLHDEATLNTPAPTPAQRPAGSPGQGQGQAAVPQGLMSPLIYPVLALPMVYDDIFSPPASSPWPFSFDAILQTAFAKASTDQGTPACPQLNRQPAVFERIRSAIRPTANQAPAMQKLAGALGFAADYLAKACPSEIPQEPAARMQLMEWQIEKIAEALDFVRPPLQELEQTLNDAQRARFGAPAVSAANRAERPMPAACAVAPTKVDASIEQISLAVQPTDDQRDAMAALKQAFRNAAQDLDANCPLASPADPLARLQATQARLDATWRALVSIQTALADFKTKLSAEQRVRFDATDFAAAQ